MSSEANDRWILNRDETEPVQSPMRLPTILILSLISIGSHAGRSAEVSDTASLVKPIARLYHKGGIVPINTAEQASIHSKAIELLKSSNFNSHSPPGSVWNRADFLQNYRETVAGNYMLISFESPQTIKTLGGPLEVREIILGLNLKSFAGPLYTIDSEERIVAHSKYSGPLCIEILEMTKKAADEQ